MHIVEQLYKLKFIKQISNSINIGPILSVQQTVVIIEPITTHRLQLQVKDTHAVLFSAHGVMENCYTLHV